MDHFSFHVYPVILNLVVGICKASAPSLSHLPVLCLDSPGDRLADLGWMPLRFISRPALNITLMLLTTALCVADAGMRSILGTLDEATNGKAEDASSARSGQAAAGGPLPDATMVDGAVVAGTTMPVLIPELLSPTAASSILDVWPILF